MRFQSSGVNAAQRGLSGLAPGHRAQHKGATGAAYLGPQTRCHHGHNGRAPTSFCTVHFLHLDSGETLSSPGSSSLAAWGPHSLLTALSEDASITAPVASCREVWPLGRLPHPGPQLVLWGCSCGSKATYIPACRPQLQAQTGPCVPAGLEGRTQSLHGPSGGWGTAVPRRAAPSQGDLPRRAHPGSPSPGFQSPPSCVTVGHLPPVRVQYLVCKQGE